MLTERVIFCTISSVMLCEKSYNRGVQMGWEPTKKEATESSWGNQPDYKLI